MKCPSCDAEWRPEKFLRVLATCPFCEERLVKKEDTYIDSIEKLLQVLIKENGKNLYKKENSAILKDFLRDFGIKFSNERKLLNVVIDEGIQEKLLDIDDGSTEEKHNVVVSCCTYLMNDIGFTENRAMEAVNILTAGLGWETLLSSLEYSELKQKLSTNSGIQDKESKGTFEFANALIARKTLVFFYLIDLPDSMDETEIASLNEALKEHLSEMKRCSDDSSDFVAKLAVMKVSNGADWITTRPVDFGDFEWIDLNSIGASCLGEAFKLLNSKLSKDEFLQDKIGNLPPTIILMSNGKPNDDFESGLVKLKENRWFRHAIKVAVAIGDDADKNVLADFTGTNETVIEAKNKHHLKKMIQFVSVKTSTRGTSNTGGGTDPDASAEAAQKDVAEMIQDQIEEENESGTGTLPAGWV